MNKEMGWGREGGAGVVMPPGSCINRHARWTKRNMAALVRWGHHGDNKDILRLNASQRFKVSIIKTNGNPAFVLQLPQSWGGGGFRVWHTSCQILKILFYWKSKFKKKTKNKRLFSYENTTVGRDEEKIKPQFIAIQIKYAIKISECVFFQHVIAWLR